MRDESEIRVKVGGYKMKITLYRIKQHVYHHDICSNTNANNWVREGRAEQGKKKKKNETETETKTKDEL